MCPLHLLKTHRLPALAPLALAAALILPAALCQNTRPDTPLLAPDAVRRMVEVETSARKGHERFSYLEKERSTRTGGHLWLQAVIETPDGNLSRLLAIDDEPLPASQQRAEDDRVRLFVSDPSLLRRENDSRREDESRIATVLEELPTLFLYTYAVSGPGTLSILFQPNPTFHEKTYQDRILHGVSGVIQMQDAPGCRLEALQGKLQHEVDFGFGLLGRVKAGSSFAVRRVEVAPDQWKTAQISVHVVGNLLLLKSISRDQEVSRFDFLAVPSSATLPQSAALLFARHP